MNLAARLATIRELAACGSSFVRSDVERILFGDARTDAHNVGLAARRASDLIGQLVSAGYAQKIGVGFALTESARAAAGLDPAPAGVTPQTVR